MKPGFVITIIAAILGWWAISVLRSQTTTTAASEDKELREMQQMAPKAPPREPAVASKSQTNPVVPPVEKIPPAPAQPFSYQKELEAYGNLHRKVFLTDDERREKKDLLDQPRFLKALALRLVEPSLDADVKASQDLAVDLLLDAWKSGDREEASAALKYVVEDGQVENQALDQSVRQNLAGLKAEILYHWTALDPSQVASLAKELPGPVSQGIWSNVQRRQADNLAASQQEVDAYHTSHR